MFQANPALPSAQLPKFFSTEIYRKLQQAKLTWKSHNHPIEHKYERAVIPAAILKTINNPEVHKAISSITGKKTSKLSGEFIRLKHQDFSLMHDEHIEKPGTDIIIDLTNDWPIAGGLITYFVDGQHIPLPPLGNTLSIIQRKNNVQKYFKYVNNNAGRKKRVLLVLNARS